MNNSKDYNERNDTGRRRPQDDIPYEQIMKHIIIDYKRIREQLDKLAAYTKKLERDYENEKNLRIGKGEKNKRIGEKCTRIQRKYKRLYAYVEWLKEKYHIPDDISEFCPSEDEEE